MKTKDKPMAWGSVASGSAKQRRKAYRALMRKALVLADRNSRYGLPLMQPKPLREQASKDCLGARWRCLACGHEVDDFLCNDATIAARPEAGEWDWWAACSNAACEHSHGEGYFQNDLDWTAPLEEKKGR